MQKSSIPFGTIDWSKVEEGERVLPIELEWYLHEHIPLSKATEVSVVSVAEDTVILRAAANINHRETVFGGSASAIAVLAAWRLLHARLRRRGDR